MDSVTGVLKPAARIDFEKLASLKGDSGKTNVRSLHITVRAQDFGVPPLSSEVPLIVYVQDINDHAPHFAFDLYEQTIPEDLPGGKSILQVINL